MSLYLGTDRIDAGSAVSSDNKSITTNSLAQIQAVGVIDNNNSSTAIKTWTGTLNEYNALGTYNPDWLYYITDDITSEGIAPSPTGSIIAFGGSTAPNGWLICNGGEISRSTYSLLFSVIGTTYGAGDGSTTFNLPSLLDGRTPIGGNSTYIGTTHKGKAPNITGRYGDWASNIINTWLTGAFYDDRGIVQDEAAVAKNPGESGVVGSCGFSARRCSTVYTDSIDYIEPKALYTNYIIKY